MGLPLEDRAHLARELIESLEPTDSDVALEGVWLEEIESRADAFDRGEAEADDWRTSLVRVRKELREGRQPCSQALSMLKPFDQRNQTDAARRRLKSLAKASGIEIELVSALANFTWDYDPGFGNEAIGWVSNAELSLVAENQLGWIAAALKLPPDFILEFDQAVEDVIQAHATQSIEGVWANFCSAAVKSNYAHVSEFASHHYLRGVNDSRINSLAWKGNRVGMVEIARNLFLKVFRGGAIERYDLAYLWCDLAVPMGSCPTNASKATPWIEPLLTSVESLPPNSGLRDLLACCKGLIGGDKHFKQEVLQSLAYADVLRVTGLPVSDMFIADRRNELSPHFYSNEWSFPLRFWASNGGTVNRNALPAHKAT